MKFLTTLFIFFLIFICFCNYELYTKVIDSVQFGEYEIRLEMAPIGLSVFPIFDDGILKTCSYHKMNTRKCVEILKYDQSQDVLDFKVKIFSSSEFVVGPPDGSFEELTKSKKLYLIPLSKIGLE